MARVEVNAVSKTFGRFRALDDVSIAFPDGGLYALLGPSGSGKTTLLRVIAGFEFADGGSVTVAGQPVDRVPVEKRDVGMMFQNYALFPNMSVYDNVAFGLSVRGVARREIRRRVAETLRLVQLDGLQKRRPTQLSGGQKQRVALARALIVRPRVLLLDEPLSALDKALRLEMQIELRRIQREVGITTIFVTHDQQEALSLSDRIGLLRDGALVQQGPPREVYERPASVFAATFLGDANVFEGEIVAGDRGGAALRLAGGGVLRAPDAGAGAWPGGGPGALAVRPEKIRLEPEPEPAAPASGAGGGGVGDETDGLDATVAAHVFSGNSLTYLLDWRGRTLKVFSQNSGAGVVPVGAPVRCRWRVAHAVALPL